MWLELLVWNHVVLPTITDWISSWIWNISTRYTETMPRKLRDKLSNKKRAFAISTIQSHTDPEHLHRFFMHFANHYKKFAWEQSRRLAGARQCWSSRLSGLGSLKKLFNFLTGWLNFGPVVAICVLFHSLWLALRRRRDPLMSWFEWYSITMHPLPTATPPTGRRYPSRSNNLQFVVYFQLKEIWAIFDMRHLPNTRNTCIVGISCVVFGSITIGFIENWVRHWSVD